MEPTGKRLGPPLSTDSIQALRDLIAESKALRADIDQDRRMWRMRLRFVIGLVVLAVLMLGGLLTLVVQFENDRRERSAANAAILEQTARTAELIADCTTVGGDCYSKGQARGQDAVRGAIRGYIAVAQCQRVTDTDAELERCVMRRLATDPAAAPSPSPSVTP